MTEWLICIDFYVPFMIAYIYIGIVLLADIFLACRQALLGYSPPQSRSFVHLLPLPPEFLESEI